MDTKFFSEDLKVRDHSKDTDVDGRITSDCILKETVWVVVDWSHLAQNRDK
jgi:hypothetical protein